MCVRLNALPWNHHITGSFHHAASNSSSFAHVTGNYVRAQNCVNIHLLYLFMHMLLTSRQQNLNNWFIQLARVQHQVEIQHSWCQLVLKCACIKGHCCVSPKKHPDPFINHLIIFKQFIFKKWRNEIYHFKFSKNVGEWGKLTNEWHQKLELIFSQMLKEKTWSAKLSASINSWIL